MVTKNERFHLENCGDEFLFGIALRRVALLTALPERPDYRAFIVDRHRDWLSMILEVVGQGSVIDLRYISEPNPQDQTLGAIRIGLIFRVTGDLETAESKAEQSLSLIQTLFDDEYAMSRVISAEELEQFRNPFPISDAVDIFRRADQIVLDIPYGNPPTSSEFLADSDSFEILREYDEGVASHVYRFIPSNNSATDMFRMLQSHGNRVALSVRISGTVLRRDEMNFLLSQVSRCENYVTTRFVGMDGGDFSRREQARVLHKSFLNVLGSLQSQALEMRIQIVSESLIPKSIVQIIGNYITEPLDVSEKFGSSLGMLDTTIHLNGGFHHSAIPEEKGIETAREWKEVTMPPIIESNGVSVSSRLQWLFDPREAVSAFHLPYPTNEEIPGVDCKGFRTKLMTEPTLEGQLIGHSRHNNFSKEVRLASKDRRRHVYAVGQTGTGKSTMFRSMILEDMRTDKGVCVIDPHGDLIDDLLQEIPEHRKEDVIILDPSDLEMPVGINVLEYRDEAEKTFLIQEILSIIKQLLPDQAMAGPVFFMNMKNALKLVMSRSQEPGTLPQVYKIFQDEAFFKRFLPYEGNDPILQNYIESVLMNNKFTKVNSEGVAMGAWISSKLESFVTDSMLLNIFGQRKSTIDFKTVMDEGKILFVNLSKGRMGELNSRFLGMVIIAKLTAAAMSRTSSPTQERRDFYLYVDEFQNLATENFSVLLAEARKYRLNLILTNQFITQVPDFIREAIMGNVGTMISFRVGSLDAEYLERDFIPVFNRFDLMNLPNFYTYVSALMQGNVTQPFSMRIVSEKPTANPELTVELRRRSRERYGRPRLLVEVQTKETLE